MGQAMNGGKDGPPADGFWATARQRYEDGREAVSAIATDAGISPQALTRRAKAEGWKLRGSTKKKPVGTRETIARLKTLLQRRLTELEAQIGDLRAGDGGDERTRYPRHEYPGAHAGEGAGT